MKSENKKDKLKDEQLRNGEINGQFVYEAKRGVQNGNVHITLGKAVHAHLCERLLPFSNGEQQE